MSVLRRTTLTAAFLVLGLACDKKEAPDEKASEDAKAEAKDEAKDAAKDADEVAAKADEIDPSKPSADWPKQPLAKVEDEVDGVKFTIALPEKLRREVKESDGTFPGYVTWNGANPLMDPTFTVQIDSFPPADLDAAARKVDTHPQPAEVARKEQLPDGGMLLSFTETSKKFVSVRAWQTSASTQKVVRVTLQVRDSQPIPNLDELRPWMESVASSFAVQ
jgi:hypothetical protein